MTIDPDGLRSKRGCARLDKSNYKLQPTASPRLNFALNGCFLAFTCHSLEILDCPFLAAPRGSIDELLVMSSGRFR
jgi:hypothetical protein